MNLSSTSPRLVTAAMGRSGEGGLAPHGRSFYPGLFLDRVPSRPGLGNRKRCVATDLGPSAHHRTDPVLRRDSDRLRPEPCVGPRRSLVARPVTQANLWTGGTFRGSANPVAWS